MHVFICFTKFHCSSSERAQLNRVEQKLKAQICFLFWDTASSAAYLKLRSEMLKLKDKTFCSTGLNRLHNTLLGICFCIIISNNDLYLRKHLRPTEFPFPLCKRCNEPVVSRELLTPWSWPCCEPAPAFTSAAVLTAGMNPCSKHKWVLEIHFSHSLELLDPRSRALS